MRYSTGSGYLFLGIVNMLVGCIIFGGVMTVLKWDFGKLSTNKYETNTYEINEAFKQIFHKTSSSI